MNVNTLLHRFLVISFIPWVYSLYEKLSGFCLDFVTWLLAQFVRDLRSFCWAAWALVPPRSFLSISLQAHAFISELGFQA